jgi:hypothetical protein
MKRSSPLLSFEPFDRIGGSKQLCFYPIELSLAGIVAGIQVFEA